MGGDRGAIDVVGDVVRGKLRRRPVPDAGRNIAAEGVEVRGIVRESGRIIERAGAAAVHAAEGRALGDRVGRGAVMRFVAHTELEVLPLAVVDLVLTLDLAPLFLLFTVDVLPPADPP